MLKNYLKIAWRNLRKNKLYTLVNIVGLTIGIVSCLLIGVYIKQELSYDRFNQNADRIVRVTMDYKTADAVQKIALTGTKPGPQFKRTFPQVEDFVRLFKVTKVVGYNGQLFEESNYLYADASFFKIFTYKLVSGNPTTALDAPNKIVITENTAKKYFNKEDPTGKILKVGDKSFIVSAIAANTPANSQIQFDFVVPFNYLSASKEENWWEANYTTYLLLKTPDQLAPLQSQVSSYMHSVSETELKMTGDHYLTYHFEPLAKVHLFSNLPDSLEPNGSITYIYIMVIVGLLILIIACVNYVNLTVAQSAGRSGEIGIRKVLGAAKSQLFNQFVGESLLVSAIAIFCAFGLAFLLLPVFNQISGKQFGFDVLFDPVILTGLIILGLLIGFFAGVYPAVLLSNSKLISILKSGFSFTSGKGVRKSLIILQFVISVFLIITTVIILQQLSFIRNKDIGYNKSNVLVLPVDYKMQPQLDALKNAIAGLPGVDGVAAANNEPIDVKWGDGITTTDGKSVTVNALPMDEDFIKTMKLKIVAGNSFNQTDVLQIDTTNNNKNFHYSFMINESAARALGWTPEQAVGKEISKGATGKIKGVVQDFNFKSFHDPIGPLLIFLDHFQNHALFVRINGNNTASALNAIEKIWKERVPHRPFDYHFLDDDYNSLYKTEQHTAGVFSTFSLLAIILACLGLFAVTAYSIVQRTKEIGIRKVLGANVPAIIMLILKDFLILIVIAAAVASPIAWYLSKKWLQDFAYRIAIEWWVFILASVVCLLVASITISFQAIKIALTNPIKSLKTD